VVILILGGGYAGIHTAKVLEKKLKNRRNIRIQLIDKNPYHTLMTQLHEVAGYRVKPHAVRIPYDSIFKNDSVQVIQDEVKEFDFVNRVLISGNNKYNYDYLVIATGSRPDFFGVEGVEKYGYKMWSYKEAVTVRSMIYDQFSEASKTSSSAQRGDRLRFVIAGGGFTGVELAGELGFWKKSLCREFDIDYGVVEIYLIEAMTDILNTFPPGLRKKSKSYLKKLGVEVVTNCAISKVDGNKIFLGSGQTLNGTLIWTAGIKGNPYIKNADINYDEKRHWINVNEYTQSASHENVFCVGDSLLYVYKGRPVPKIIETCIQSGDLAAKNIIRLIDGKRMKVFEPKYHGSMVSIGPIYGVAKIGAIRFKWLFATLIKHLANLHYLHGIGGIKLDLDYINNQFIDLFLRFFKKKEDL